MKKRPKADSRVISRRVLVYLSRLVNERGNNNRQTCPGLYVVSCVLPTKEETGDD